MTVQVSVAGSDYRFPCESGESLLDAAERAGFEMPYSCRKGICSSCTGRVEAGEVAAVGAGAPPQGAEPGTVLFCRCTPLTDVAIRPASIKPLDRSARKRAKARIYRVEHPADDVTVLRLRLPAGVRAKFLAGQYLQVILEDGRQRQFSLANPPALNDEAHLHIRHVENGYFTGQVLPGLQAGQFLEIELPYGDFHLRDGHQGPLVFVATGTGFAPIASIIEDMHRRKIDRPFTFYWGARTARHLYALDTVAKWQARQPGMRFVPVLSDEPPAALAGARGGMVHEAVLQDHPRLDQAQVYACGAPAMINAARAAFGPAGLLPGAFFCDAFVAGPA